MKKWILALSLMLAPLIFAVEQVTPATMLGKYVWNREPETPGDLRAEFKPATDGTWSVSFHFTWHGDKYVYKGTATGNLADGALEGRVLNEEKKRTFVFRGTSSKGHFTGTHAELDPRGKETARGTMELDLKP